MCPFVVLNKYFKYSYHNIYGGGGGHIYTGAFVGPVIGFVDKIIDEIQVLEKIHVYRLVFDNGF